MFAYSVFDFDSLTLIGAKTECTCDDGYKETRCKHKHVMGKQYPLSPIGDSSSYYGEPLFNA